ncbi:MAG: futalosine hydrolase [Blastocatellia bacterium]|nr:futalosine hydrolase [Blastocatellia bacterium]
MQKQPTPFSNQEFSILNSNFSILLVAAVEREAADLLPRIQFKEEKQFGVWTTRYGVLNGHSVAFLLTGVGMVRTTAALATVLGAEPFAAVLQFGVGGAYPNSGLKIGDVVLADSECDPQSGIVTPAGFRDLRGLGFGLTEDFPNRISLENPWSAEVAARLPQVLRAGVATVASCSGTDEVALEMERRSGAKVEAMEGFPAAWIAQCQHIPFAELRVVSNTTGDRARQEWNLPLACQVLAGTVQMIFSQSQS